MRTTVRTRVGFVLLRLEPDEPKTYRLFRGFVAMHLRKLERLIYCYSAPTCSSCWR
jgi:hypothetical protein